MTYYKITTDDSTPTFEPVEIPSDTSGFLRTCRQIISCDTIEVAPTIIRGVVLIIDESGKLQDNWQVNRVATILRGNYRDPIAGTAIIARVCGEDIVPITADDLRLLRRHYPY